MGQKRNVGLGTSLVLVAICSYYFIKGNKESVLDVNLSSKIKSSQITKKKRLISVVRGNEKITSDECSKLVKQLQLKIEAQEPSWTNYYLEKDSLNYVVRIVSESNSQGIGVKRIKFYQLDEDGFPTPYSDYNETILRKKEDLAKIMQGFKLVSTNETLNFDNYLIEKEDGEIKFIENQIEREVCHFP